MALLVHKYGGTSVGSLERIEAVSARVARHRAEGHRVVVVVSAMSGETNRLQALGLDLGGQGVVNKHCCTALVCLRYTCLLPVLFIDCRYQTRSLL